MPTKNKLALVTGGTGGLGEAICKRLADAGMEVVALHSPGNLRVAEWQAAREAQGYRFDVQPVDVSDFESCAAASESIRARHGPVSVLVNNAGITRDASFRKMSLEDWQQVLRTNLGSMFNMTKQVIEDMLALGWGRVVNISSVNGQRGAFGQANYAASKAGMIGFSKSLAQEVAARSITVNCVAPGFIASPMTEALNDQQKQGILAKIPAGRLGTGGDVAAACVYLASDEGAYVTGQTLHVNGGMAML
jgi:acetoacetyl-CoA reductase